MPITEGPVFDSRTALLNWLIEFVIDDDWYYRTQAEEQTKAIADRKALVERMTAIARKKRGHKPGTRPWQSAGFATRQAWLDGGSPLPDTPVSGSPLPDSALSGSPLPPTKHDIAAIRKRHRKGK